jgi:type IV pilus assembly protein PilY1
LRKFRDELSLQFFVDGSPQAYVQRDGSGTVTSAVLIFGLRRGGNRYMALDVTNPLIPRLLWEISPSVTGYGELGQTWSTPRLSKIKYGAGEKWVVIVGGGYDENQDNIPVTAADTKGRALYVIDALTGSLIWKYSNSENSDMRHSIPSDIARVDTNGDGYTDRLYVGDLGGKIWRFDISNPNPANWTGKKLFQAAGKVFSPPEVTLEKDEGNYEMLFFGTGDREDPKDTVSVSKLYAVKDKNPSTALTETDLLDLTEDLLQAPGTSESEKSAIHDLLKQKKGWYITLNQGVGEKCLAGTVAFAGSVYYTTFTPTLNASSDICSVGDGVARLYILDFKSGIAVFNLDAANDLEGSDVITRSDRSMVIGAGIPSGVIFAVTKGAVTAYGGVGGGIFSPPLPGTKTLVPINWRVVF